jgi:hypothetical protein
VALRAGAAFLAAVAVTVFLAGVAFAAARVVRVVAAGAAFVVAARFAAVLVVALASAMVASSGIGLELLCWSA